MPLLRLLDRFRSPISPEAIQSALINVTEQKKQAPGISKVVLDKALAGPLNDFHRELSESSSLFEQRLLARRLVLALHFEKALLERIVATVRDSNTSRASAIEKMRLMGQQELEGILLRFAEEETLEILNVSSEITQQVHTSIFEPEAVSDWLFSMSMLSQQEAEESWKYNFENDPETRGQNAFQFNLYSLWRYRFDQILEGKSYPADSFPRDLHFLARNINNRVFEKVDGRIRPISR